MTSVISKLDGPIAPSGPRAGGQGETSARNVRLQQLRGLAALSVLLYHVSSYVKDATGDSRFLDIFSGYWGVFGVAIFFVLSGYLMAQLSRRDEPMRFLLDRILRIYPLLLIVLAMALLAFYLAGYGRRPDFVAISLIPAGPRDYFLGIEWTLLFEMTYYVVIAALAMLGLRRVIEPLFALWLGALLLIGLAGLAPAEVLTPTLSRLPAQTANCAFLMGFLLPLVLKAGWLPPAPVLWLIAVPIAALHLVIPGIDVRWTAALSASCLVAGALRAQNVGATGVLDGIGLRLGDASYALYLCHVPIIILGGHLLPTGIPAWALWIGWSCAAIAAALCLGPLDLRLHRRLKRWASSLSRPRIAALSLAFLAAFIAIAGYFDGQSRMNDWAQGKARSALASSEAQIYPNVRTAIESTALMPDGRLNVRGYGIDLDSPDDDGHIAIEQGGQIIAIDRMRRLMSAVALKFARPDLKPIRFGFSLVSPDVFDCSKGPLQAKFVFPDGRVTPVAGDALGTVCQGSPPATKP